MSSPIYEKRQADKKLKEQSRKAAARLHGCEVNLFGDVKLMQGGAFVEVVVWVPLEEIIKGEPVSIPVQPDDFGGSDEGSHYMSQTAAKGLIPKKPMPRVYIAAPYELREEAKRIRLDLIARGFIVTSRWLTQTDENGDEFARMDLADVAAADVLLALNPADFANKGTGGRHVELGYALALGKEVAVVGVRSNIFHYLSDVRIIASAEELLVLLFAKWRRHEEQKADERLRKHVTTTEGAGNQ